MSRLPVRIQIAVGSRLVAEAIVEQHMLDAFQPGGGVFERWARLRYARGEEIGCSVSARADLPRTWNVPVGSEIH